MMAPQHPPTPVLPHEEIIDSNQNNYFNQDEDDKLFLATGYRHSFAYERGFPYPWCAKKHGRKGWLVRDRPPLTYNADDVVASTKSVEFKGWKEAEKAFHSQQMLMQRFGIQNNSLSGNQDEVNESNLAKQAVDHWFQQTPAAMKHRRTVNQEAMQYTIEKKRKRDEVDLRRKQREELRETRAKEKMERRKQKALEKLSNCCHREAVVESANSNEGIDNLGSGAPESQLRHISSKETSTSSPPSRAKSKRKGTHPKRGDKYRDIERSFIENKSLLQVPTKSHDSNSLCSPSTPTKTTKTNDVTNQLPCSPTRTKYKGTQPRKNQHYNSQSSGIILGEDPLMDQMIEDIVKEFTTEGPLANGHIFDGGAVSALREAAMDVVVHNREEKEKSKLAFADSFSVHSPQHLDLDDRRVENMIEQLIGEVAGDCGCNFEGDAVEALKMAAREIVTNDDDFAQAESATETAASKVLEGTTKNTEESSSRSCDYIPPLRLDNDGSNMSEIGSSV